MTIFQWWPDPACWPDLLISDNLWDPVESSEYHKDHVAIIVSILYSLSLYMSSLRFGSVPRNFIKISPFLKLKMHIVINFISCDNK